MSDSNRLVPPEHILQTLAQRFPQLSLEPEAGLSATPLYKTVVGERLPLPLKSYVTSAADRFWTEETPGGSVEVLLLGERTDFERAYRLLARRGEPEPIPPSMGASTLIGLIDRQKLERARRELVSAEEIKAASRCTLILLSAGPYSRLSAEKTPFSHDEWLEISLNIRLYHELAHVTCRRLYPQWKSPVFDELAADAYGLIRAVGSYDLSLAKAFLGVTESGYIRGGRLENYTSTESLDALAAAVNAVMERLHETLCRDEGQPYAPLLNWMANAAELAAPIDAVLSK